MLESYLNPAVEEVKKTSETLATQEEIYATINEEDSKVEQFLLENEDPVHRIQALFDMGWQVRSSGGKYGSSTGHAFLILDSIVFNKSCGVCTKHERRTGALDNV